MSPAERECWRIGFWAGFAGGCLITAVIWAAFFVHAGR